MGGLPAPTVADACHPAVPARCWQIIPLRKAAPVWRALDSSDDTAEVTEFNEGMVAHSDLTGRTHDEETSDSGAPCPHLQMPIPGGIKKAPRQFSAHEAHPA